MENFEAFILAIAFSVVIIMSAVLIVVVIILLRTAMALRKEKIISDCDCKNSQCDEGHPEFPWKCNDCGKRH